MKKTARIVFIVAMAGVQVAADAMLAFPSWDWAQAKAHLRSEQQKQEQKDQSGRDTLKDAPNAAAKPSAASKRARARRSRDKRKNRL